MKIELTPKQAWHLWCTVHDDGIREELRKAMDSENIRDNYPVKIQYKVKRKAYEVTVPSSVLVRGQLDSFVPAGALVLSQIPHPRGQVR